mmetsp:Transcript_9719/g.19124  ORF Transcript_9719/g.19124 Transcript_9719/m.19124 type:complete len:203 (-) Transcript_9719:166-774(-)
MLTPQLIRGGLVENPCQEQQVVGVDRSRRDAKFMIKFPARRSSSSNMVLSLFQLLGAVERMRAACVRPRVWKRDLLARALLKEEASLRVEQEHRKGAVEGPAFVNVLEQVGVVLGGVACDLVRFVDQDALFPHQLHLSRICAFQRAGGRQAPNRHPSPPAHITVPSSPATPTERFCGSSDRGQVGERRRFRFVRRKGSGRRK